MSSTLSKPTIGPRLAIPGPITTTAQRLVWAASGFGFLVFTATGLLFASVFASAFYPSPFGPQTDVAAYFAANRSQVQAMSFVYSVAALSLLVFVAYCAGMLADRAPGRRSALPGLALGAGALAAGFWLLNALLLWILSQPEAADTPGLLRSMHNLVYLTGGPAHVLTLGGFLGAVSAALWRASVLPRWVAWTGAAAPSLSMLSVLALLWTPASLLLPVGRGLAMLWILATSVALLVGRSGAAMVDAAAALDDRGAARGKGPGRMKLGLHIAMTNWAGGAARLGPTLIEVVEAAEHAGFDAISVTDHVWGSKYTGGVEASQIEAYTTLGFIAARTRRARLLTLATAVPYRHAGLLGKAVTTLDVLSGGRAMLGIGAGDYPEEAAGLGLPYPPTGERFDMLEETVQACLRLWHGEHGDERPFHGDHVHMERPLNVPQSLSRPHPPILIAGSGERRTLPLVARYADACNIRPSPEIPRQLELLKRLCDEAGRDDGAIEKTAPFAFDVGPDGTKVGELVGQLRWLAGMGIETVFGWVVGVDRIEPIEVMGREVIPVVAEL